MILAGDIGGTHMRLALFEALEELKCKAEKTFLSRNYASLEEIIREFLGNERVSRACLGIAGPIQEGRCQMTNLPWIVDASALSQQLKIPSVELLNDLEANAYGIRALKKDELYLLYPGGGTAKKGNAALIAAGTGLGEAGLYWDGRAYRPFACEGGHADFAPRNQIEFELFLYLKKKFAHVSYERVVSGPGIYEIYSFLTETQRHLVNPAVQEEIKHRDPPTVISEYGRLNKDSACVEAIDWFLSLYGSEAGNLALKMFATGGIYIGGGIAPNLIDQFKRSPFLSSFVDKGRLKNLLASIPIWVILNDRAALLGAAYFAKRHQL